MTPREIILEQIDHHETTPIPYTLGFEGDIPEQLDNYYGSADWRGWLTTYINHLAGIDTVQEKPIDELHTRDIFGGIWRHDRRPFHLVEPALKEPSFENYEFPTADQFYNPEMANVAQQLRNGEHADAFNVVFCGWGLLEQSWRIRGYENVLMDCIAEPDFYGELLDRLTDLYLSHVQQCADVPADAIMFGDDWGDQRGNILGPDRWRKFLKPRWAKLYQAAHDQGKLAISHCCGSVGDIMGDIVEIGLDVLESVQPEPAKMNPYELKRKWGDKITFWGALGSQSTMQFGTPADIRNEVKHLRSEMGKGGGYILAPAKDIQPGTPIENAAAAVEAFCERA